MMRRAVFRAALIAPGMIAAFGAGVRANEAIDASRETIIQGVRDDVRRKIRERSEMPEVKRPEVASEAKPSISAPPQSDPKPDAPK
jgi:hypothetical protein